MIKSSLRSAPSHDDDDDDSLLSSSSRHMKVNEVAIHAPARYRVNCLVFSFRL